MNHHCGTDVWKSALGSLRGSMTLFWQTVQSASFHMGAAVYDVASESPVKPRFERVLELMRAGDRRGPERDTGPSIA